VRFFLYCHDCCTELASSQEWIELLRDMVLKLPKVAKFSSFKALCSEDAEVDFFNNIIHLQVNSFPL
jgi:U3 small nucleolar RNA-associated protein 20